MSGESKGLWPAAFETLCCKAELLVRTVAYGFADTAVKNRLQVHKAQGYTPSCQIGCAACCRMAPTATMVEALAILQYVPGINRALVAEHAAFLLQPQMTVKQWFGASKACALLENELCSVYEARPYMCRSYFVASPPVDCAVIGGIAAQLRMPSVSLVIGVFEEIAAAIGVPHLYGPLPVMLQIAIEASNADDPVAAIRDNAAECGMGSFAESLNRWVSYESQS